MSLLRRLLTDPLSLMRLLVVLLMLLVLAPAIFRLWCIKGLVRTVRIDGGSMAETFCGTHFRITCGDCGIIFRCDGDFFPADRRAVCPSCGFRDNELRDKELRRGDRVLVDSWPYLWSSPRRGDVVMLAEPQFQTARYQDYAIKRIVGLPGDSVSLSEGDLWINSRRQKKTLREMRELAVLVHNNDHLPGSLPNFPRWRAASLQSGWRAVGKELRLVPAAALAKDLDWLTYEHWRCDGNPLPRTDPAVVFDNDGYNQAQTRELNPVHDLMLSCRARFAENTEFVMQLRDEEAVMRVRLDLRRSLAIASIDDRPATSVGLPSDLAGRTIDLQAALIDGDLLLAIDGRILLCVPYQRPPLSNRQHDASSRLQIAAAGGPAELAQLSVYRDIYYYGPRGEDNLASQGPLRAGHFLLLGDNPPISIDSRHWPGSGLPRQHILGKVFAFSPRR